MSEEIFNALYIGAFKEAIVGDIAKCREYGLNTDMTAMWLDQIYGDDLRAIGAEGANHIAQSLSADGYKYRFRERNRMSMTDFQKAVGFK